MRHNPAMPSTSRRDRPKTARWRRSSRQAFSALRSWQRPVQHRMFATACRSSADSAFGDGRHRFIVTAALCKCVELPNKVTAIQPRQPRKCGSRLSFAVFAVACRAPGCIATIAVGSDGLAIRRARPLHHAGHGKQNNGQRHPHEANPPLRQPYMPRICGCSGSFGASYCWQNSLRMTFKRGSTLGAATVMAALYFFLYLSSSSPRSRPTKARTPSMATTSVRSA